MYELKNTYFSLERITRSIFGALGLVLIAVAATAAVHAHPEISMSDDDKTMIVGDAPEETVFSFGKSVEIKKSAKGVLAVGGDVYIDGQVEGDVGTIGGNVVQRQGGRVNGDILVVGGSFKDESTDPARPPGKQTMVIGVFEEQVRDLAQNPSQLIAPSFTWEFFAQRLLLALFWFVISLIVTTVAPGAVGRAVSRISLSSLKVTAFGSVAFVLTMITIVGSFSVLPDYLSVTFGLMGITLLLFGYVFGRVALQVSFGKMIQKRVLAEGSRSETLSTLFGVLFWTILLSIPYLWIVSLFAVFAVGVGLIITARSTPGWQKV